jgi:hypothetical protein
MIFADRMAKEFLHPIPGEWPPKLEDRETRDPIPLDPALEV